MKHSTLAIFIPHAGCPHRCSFCDQKRISGKNKAPSVEEVESIIRSCAESPDHRADSAQIAFFGGSFTCIPREQMIAYLEIAAAYVRQGKYTGIRISTRPDGIDPEILSILKRYYVTNIELGAQSMDNEILKCANRGHTREDTIRASKMIKTAGFTLGLQLLIGLPGDTKKTALRSALEIAALEPSEVRLYPISVFPETELYSLYQSGAYQPLTTEEAVNWIVPIADYLEQNDIKLLRIGLHQADGAVAGAFHPAFGEMVRTGQFNLKLKELLPPAPAKTTVRVPPQLLSIAIGQKRSNLDYWEKEGYHLSFVSGKQGDQIKIDV